MKLRDLPISTLEAVKASVKDKNYITCYLADFMDEEGFLRGPVLIGYVYARTDNNTYISVDNEDVYEWKYAIPTSSRSELDEF